MENQLLKYQIKQISSLWGPGTKTWNQHHLDFRKALQKLPIITALIAEISHMEGRLENPLSNDWFDSMRKEKIQALRSRSSDHTDFNREQPACIQCSY